MYSLSYFIRQTSVDLFFPNLSNTNKQSAVTVKTTKKHKQFSDKFLSTQRKRKQIPNGHIVSNFKAGPRGIINNMSPKGKPCVVAIDQVDGKAALVYLTRCKPACQ